MIVKLYHAGTAILTMNDGAWVVRWKPILAWRVNQIRDSSGNKHCIKCSAWLSEDNFQVNKKTADGLMPWCRKCSRWRGRRHFWGLTPQKFKDMLAAQDGKCPVCDEELTEHPLNRGYRISVDHDHKCCPGPKSCGKCIRGLLHLNCNSLLGLARDSSLNLRRAAFYLEDKEMEMSR